MTDFFYSYLMAFQALPWPVYIALALATLALALLLKPVAKRVLQFTSQMLFLVLLLLLLALGFDVSSDQNMGQSLYGLAIIVFGMVVIRQAALVFFRLIVPKLGLAPPRILEEILILFAYVAWILLRLSQVGLDLSSLVASTAVITAIVAFAMQDTLGNVLAGLALQLDHSIHIGDWVEIDEIAGQVEQVQWRHAAVRTLFGELVLIPNSHLMRSRVILTGGPQVPKRIRAIAFYCDFSTRPTRVIRAVEQALAQAEFENIAKQPLPRCIVSDFAAGYITYTVRYWLTNPRAAGSSDSLIRQHIHAVFQREGWHMAAPGMELSVATPRTRRQQEDTHQESDNLRRVQTLRAVDLFSPLTDDELQDLATQLKAVPYIAGSVLAYQGEEGDSLFIIASGRAAVWLHTQEARHFLAEVGEGEVLGEMSLMTGEPRRATLTARTDMLCYVLNKQVFQKLLSQRPELADMFAQLLAVRNQELVEVRDAASALAVSAEKAIILERIRRLFRI